MNLFSVFKNLKNIDQIEVPPRYAAVCYLVVPGKDEMNVILTRRSTKLRSHGGQISFAGGKNDPNDQGIVGTALRELKEELGVDEHKCSIVGVFPERRSINGLIVFPLLVQADLFIDHEWLKNDDEVDAVYSVPLSELTRNKAQSFDFVMFGHQRSSIHFETPQVSLWGLTAHIIYESHITLEN